MQPQRHKVLRSTGSWLRRRYWLVFILLLLGGAAAVRLSTLQGLVVPVRIQGPSMAPAFMGERLEIKCPDCAFPFACDATIAARSLRRIVCPNCGYAIDGNTAAREICRGERVLIDRLSYTLGSPQRYDVVAAHSDDGLVTKRIVGLPGEQISIVRGELLVNGKWQRKSLDEFWETAVLVHDSRYSPRATTNLPPRWVIRRDATDFHATYHNWRCYENPLARDEEAPISDHDWYNQGHSRTVNYVRDVVVRAELTMKDEGLLHLFFDDSGGDLYAGIAYREIRVFRYGQELFYGDLPNVDLLTPTRVWEFGVVDGRLIVAADKQLLCSLVVDSRVPNTMTTPQPISVGALLCGEVTARRLQIYRDIYYLAPDGQNTKWTAPTLKPEEYLLLGDNAPVSRDSRHWGPVNKSAIVGKVLPWQ